MSIIKPSIDKRIYKHLVLPNNIKALIIEDKELTSTSVSLTVNVGHYNDPDDVPGLAHFVEHMLFMGNKKYPNTGEYTNFINSHGGYTNAFTGNTSTTYYFSVVNDYKEKAVDMFSHFFIDPLFREDNIEKEMNAVDSEHLKNTTDSWKFQSMLREISGVEPFCGFGCGNLTTLNKKGIRNDVINFYNKYYSANIMDLVILTNDENNLVKKFEKIVDKNIHISIPQIYPFEFNKINVIEMATQNDIGKLTLIWQFPKETKMCGAIDYISQLLGHESKGSLSYYLKSINFSYGLSAGLLEKDNFMYLYCIEISLTEKGFKYIHAIINYVLYYINHILRVDKGLFEEIKKINFFTFDFLGAQDGPDYVSTLSLNMSEFPIEYILFGPYNYNCDEEYINKYIELLKTNMVAVVINSKTYLGNTNKKDKWYGAEYNIVNSLDKKFKNVDLNINKLFFPKPNILIPNKIQLLKSKNKEKYPILIENDKVELWFKQDTEFNTPFVSMNIIFTNAIQIETPENECNMMFFEQLLNYKLSSFGYYSGIANSSFMISGGSNNLEIVVVSYNDKIKKILDKILNEIVNFTVTEKEFKYIYKFIYTSFLSGYHFPPNSLANILLIKSAWTKYHTFIDLSENFNKVNIGSILKVKEWFNSPIKCLIQGNITQENAIKLTKSLNCFDVIKHDVKLHLEKDILLLNNNEQIYDYDSFDKADINSAILVFVEIGIFKINEPEWQINLCMIYLLHSIIGDYFYGELRTKEQTGYIVNSTVKILGNTHFPLLGYNFVVQSPKKNPVFLYERIKKFIDESDKYILDLSDKDFEKQKQILIDQTDTPALNMNEDVSFNLSQIAKGTYLFNFGDIQIKNIKSIKKQDLIDFHNSYFLNRGTRKFRVVRVFSHQMKEQSEEKIENPNI